MFEIPVILEQIREEVVNQWYKWGIQYNQPTTWLTILGEEFGEACKAILEMNEHEYRKELIHIAAVCASAIECVDREFYNPKGGELNADFQPNT